MSKTFHNHRKPSISCRHDSSDRSGSFRSLGMESLEPRHMLTSTLFLDLAAGMGFDAEGNSRLLKSSGTEIRNIDGVGDLGHGTGPDILVQTEAPLSSSLEFGPLVYDFNHDGNLNAGDLADLANAVLPIMERALEPFDIEVVVTSAKSLADIVMTWNSNTSADAYVLVADVISDVTNGGSFGEWAGIFGVAAGDDFKLQAGNQQDELALVFADTFLSRIPGAPGSSAYDVGLAHQIARVAVHEAFHTLTFAHTWPSGKEGILSRGDVIRCGCILFFPPAWTEPTIVTRFPIDVVDDSTFRGVGVNNYEKAAQILGLRDDDDSGVADLAYVTGTGGNEEITISLKPGSTTIVDVVVTTFEDPSRTIFYQALTYPIDLNGDTDGEILVDLSWGDDRIEIDSNIPASFRIRGMEGNDEIVFVGSGESAIRSLSIEGEAGDDTVTFDFERGDPLPQVGYSWNFIGGQGSDKSVVMDETGTPRPAFFIEASLSDESDKHLTTGAAAINTDDSDTMTLRGAIQKANRAGEPAYIFLPDSTASLTVGGSGGATQGDLDITGDVTVIGAGAGATIIVVDSSLQDTRHFEVDSRGKLELRRLTLTGGSQSNGASIRVAPDNSHTTALILDEVTVANNGNAGGVGGALSVGGHSKVAINKSVIANNVALWDGGGIFADEGAVVRLKDSIVAKSTLR